MNRFFRPASWFGPVGRNWASRLVCRETGQPLELIHIEEWPGGSRILCEFPSGRQDYLEESQITSAVRHTFSAAGVMFAVALAGIAAGLSLALPAEAVLQAVADRTVAVEARLQPALD